MNKEKIHTSEEEIMESYYLPIYLLFWIPATIFVVLTLYYDIRWQFFGITEGVNPFYVNRFKTCLDSYIYVFKEIGIFGCIGLLVMVFSYIYLTIKIIKSIIYDIRN